MIKMTMGEKIKDLRTEKGLTTKEVSQLTGISEAVYNGLENDVDRDTGYSRIIALAKFFDVPTDYLLGFTESRITKNIKLKELGLSDNAIKVLLSKNQNNDLVSELIEHKDFPNLINSIDVYVRQLAAPHIGTVNNMIKVAQHGVEGYYKDDTSADLKGAVIYINETVVNEDDFLRFRISERFNQILRDVYDNNTDKVVPKSSTNEMTSHMVDVLNMVKSGELELDTPEDAVAVMMERMGVSEEDVMRAFEELFGDLYGYKL